MNLFCKLFNHKWNQTKMNGKDMMDAIQKFNPHCIRKGCDAKLLDKLGPIKWDEKLNAEVAKIEK